MSTVTMNEIRKELEERKAYLEDSVAELDQINAALRALGAPAVSRPTAPKARAGKPASRKGRGKGRRGRPLGSGTRDKEVLGALQARPGMTVVEISQATGINQSYLYRVVGSLHKRKLVRKRKQRWFAV